MKKIFLAGSRKFADDLQNVFEMCKEAGIEVIKGRDSVKQLSDEEEKEAHKEMLRRIEKSDVVYVVSGDGYIGKTVALEIGYAIGKGKEVISSTKITEAGADSFVSKILKKEDLVEYLKPKT
jgi:nucleoside 2-deoxyribosyltransferase